MILQVLGRHSQETRTATDEHCVCFSLYLYIIHWISSSKSLLSSEVGERPRCKHRPKSSICSWTGKSKQLLDVLAFLATVCLSWLSDHVQWLWPVWCLPEPSVSLFPGCPPVHVIAKTAGMDAGMMRTGQWMHLSNRCSCNFCISHENNRPWSVTGSRMRNMESPSPSTPAPCRPKMNGYYDSNLEGFLYCPL